ncbi:hypothetical protein GCM10023152_09090 [Agromyces bauzanensis]|uniref:Uncharacterized protein n=1 Tax=Agromyces bauzanensis TaxID=1308924 RepID=A0A917PLG9_9MICO|nr:hypothetical protein GCM10011372_22060 [Agromyces bauzanensis]
MRPKGMLGGMSWESTAEHHRLASELVRKRLDSMHAARSCSLRQSELAQLCGPFSAPVAGVDGTDALEHDDLCLVACSGAALDSG